MKQDTIDTVAPIEVAQRESTPTTHRETVFDIRGLSVSYGGTLAVSDVNLEIYRNMVTALIGPSGCGKSTFIRCLNRMNDLVHGARVDGKILYHGQDLYAPGVDAVSVRRWIGMVFQKPNPFPKSIYDNVAWGPRVLGLKKSALALSGGQQQRLCIARAIAIEPDVLLLDEPASALDPIATSAIEELIHKLKRDYTIVIVTHNMQQAARVSDETGFFNLKAAGQPGRLVEFNPTKKIFSVPDEEATEAYISGRFG